MHRSDRALLDIDKNGKGLEIGPSIRPIAPKKNGFDVEIIDHASKADLIEKYQGHGVNLDQIEEVDFIWSGESYAELTDKTDHYDWIIASHLIEHTPDLIAFLRDCETVLNDTGVLSLVVPDARFCFDHFRPLSSLSTVIDTHENNKGNHSIGKISEYYLNVVSKKDAITWRATNHLGYKMIHDLDYTKSQIEAARNGDYLDIHAWCFTPTSFSLMMDDLNKLGLIDLKVKSSSKTFGTEFFVTLSKSADGLQGDRLTHLMEIHKELAKVSPREAPSASHVIPPQRSYLRRLLSKLKSTILSK